MGYCVTLPLLTKSYNTDLYSYALSAVYQFWDRVRDPSYALFQDVDIWEVLQRDPKVYQIIQQRLHDVAGPEWHVEPHNNSKDPADKTVAQVTEDAFHEIEHFADARLKAAHAVFKGQSRAFVIGKRKHVNLGGLGRRSWWVPTKIKDVDPRRFTIRPVREERPDGSVKVRGELYVSTIPMFGNPGRGMEFAPNNPNLTLYNYRKVEHPEWMLNVVYKDEESRLGYGRGLLDCMYFYHWVKQVVIKEGLQGLERWSQGIVVGTLDPDRAGVPDTQSTANERQAMMDALSKMRSRYVYVQGAHDDVKVLTGGSEGHQMVMGWLEYLDDSLMAVGTGAVLASGKNSVSEAGSFARDRVGQETQKGVIAYDKNKIDEDITSDVITLFMRMNWSTLQELGLAGAGRPNFKTVEGKMIDADRAAARFANIAQTSPGIKIREDEFFKELDLTPAGQDDKTVTLGVAPTMAEQGQGTGGMEDLFGPTQDQGADQQGGSPQPGGGPVPMRLSALPIGVRKAAAAYMRAGCSVKEAIRLALDTDGETAQPARMVSDPAQAQVTIKHDMDAGEKFRDALVQAVRDAAPTVNVSVPETKVVVNPVPAPVVNFKGSDIKLPPAPVVHVHVPEQMPPVVNVNVPEQPTPVVKVHNEIKVPEQKPSQKTVKVKRDKDGNAEEYQITGG